MPPAPLNGQQRWSHQTVMSPQHPFFGSHCNYLIVITQSWNLPTLPSSAMLRCTFKPFDQCIITLHRNWADTRHGATLIRPLPACPRRPLHVCEISKRNCSGICLLQNLKFSLHGRLRLQNKPYYIIAKLRVAFNCELVDFVAEPRCPP